MTNKEMIKSIKSNYPTSNFTMLRESLDKSIELLEREEESQLIYDVNNAIDFIAEKMNMSADRNGIIAEILETEEEYMRSIGIIKD